MCVTLDAILKFQFLPVMSSAPSSAERHLSDRCKQVLEGESTHPFLRRRYRTNKRLRFYVLHLYIHVSDFYRGFLFIFYYKKKRGRVGFTFTINLLKQYIVTSNYGMSKDGRRWASTESKNI